MNDSDFFDQLKVSSQITMGFLPQIAATYGALGEMGSEKLAKAASLLTYTSERTLQLLGDIDPPVDPAKAHDLRNAIEDVGARLTLKVANITQKMVPAQMAAMSGNPGSMGSVEAAYAVLEETVIELAQVQEDALAEYRQIVLPYIPSESA